MQLKIINEGFNPIRVGDKLIEPYEEAYVTLDSGTPIEEVPESPVWKYFIVDQEVLALLRQRPLMVAQAYGLDWRSYRYSGVRGAYQRGDSHYGWVNCDEVYLRGYSLWRVKREDLK